MEVKLEIFDTYNVNEKEYYFKQSFPIKGDIKSFTPDELKGMICDMIGFLNFCKQGRMEKMSNIK